MPPQTTTNRLPILTFEIGPGSPEWHKLLAQVKKNPLNGWSCAIDIPGRAAINRRKPTDRGWYNSRLFVHYNHVTGRGYIGVTYDGRRYFEHFDSNSEYVWGAIIPSDNRNYDKIRFMTVQLDLNQMESEEAHTVANGYSRPARKTPVGRSQQPVTAASTSSTTSSTSSTATGAQPARAKAAPVKKQRKSANQLSRKESLDALLKKLSTS